MLLCNNSEMNNENEEDLVAKMNNDNQVMLPVIDTSTRPSSSSAVNNQIYATNSVIEELQVRENLQNLMGTIHYHPILNVPLPTELPGTAARFFYH